MKQKQIGPWLCPKCGHVLADNPDGALRVAGTPARFCITGGRIVAACHKCGEVSEYQPGPLPPGENSGGGEANGQA